MGVAKAIDSVRGNLHGHQNARLPKQGSIRFGAIGIVSLPAETAPITASGVMEACIAQSLPGRTLASISLAVFFITLPNSGSLTIMVAKFRASFRVICGGNGGTLGSA